MRDSRTVAAILTFHFVAFLAFGWIAILPTPTDTTTCETTTDLSDGLEPEGFEGEELLFNVTFPDLSLDSIKSYSWDLDVSTDSDGDGNTSNDVDATGPNPSYTYGDNGVYVVEVTLEIEKTGSGVDQDTIFLIDSSSSMAGYPEFSDPDHTRIDAVQRYVENITDNDRAAVVGFAMYPPPPDPPEFVDAAWLVDELHLTNADAAGKHQIKSAAEVMRFGYGGTNIEKAVQVAHEELSPDYVPSPPYIQPDWSPPFPEPGGNGDLTHLWIEILITDGKPIHPMGTPPYYLDGPLKDEIEWANKSVSRIGPETRIYTVGLGPAVEDSYLRYIANATNASYHHAENYTALEETYLEILEEVGQKAVSEIQTRTLNVTIHNHSPLAIFGYSEDSNEYEGVWFSANASDPGSDDLAFIWDWGDGTTEAMVFYNDGVSDDPPKSPWGTYPFSAVHSTSHTWGDNGNFTVTLTVIDDDGGVTTSQTVVVVDNLDPEISNVSYDVFYNVPRTQGYWNFQCTEKLPSPDHVGIQQGFVDYISSRSSVFSGISTRDEVCGYLGTLDNSNMTQKAMQQLMALWLNVASDKVNLSSEVFVPQLNATMNLWELMEWIEDTILNDDEDNMETAKDLADAINNGNLIPHAVVTFWGTATDPGSDDLTFTWDWGDGTWMEHIHYNDGVGPDPYPSPEVNPITVTDTAVHGYASAGSYIVTLTVTDDDGGVSSYTFNLTL